MARVLAHRGFWLLSYASRSDSIVLDGPQDEEAHGGPGYGGFGGLRRGDSASHRLRDPKTPLITSFEFQSRRYRRLV